MNIPSHHALVPVKPPVSGAEHEINVPAFVVALILAPLIPAILTSPTLLAGPAALIFAIALGAIILGGLPYLILGAPILLALLSRYGNDVDRNMRAAFKASLVCIGLLCLYLMRAGGIDVTAVLFFSACILIFALLWAWIFSALYRQFDGSQSQQGWNHV